MGVFEKLFPRPKVKQQVAILTLDFLHRGKRLVYTIDVACVKNIDTIGVNIGRELCAFFDQLLTKPLKLVKINIVSKRYKSNFSFFHMKISFLISF